MSWREEYRSRCQTAVDAVSLVHPGDRVYVQEGCGTPQPLIDALVDRAPLLRNVELVHMLTLGPADYVKPEYEGIFHHRGMFLGANVRDAVQHGRAEYTPIFLSEIEGLFTSGQIPIDVAFLQTSPPDQDGYLSLGTSIDTSLTAAECAHRIVVEVNDRMPRTYGDSRIHVRQVAAFVETSRALHEVVPEPPCAVQERIADHVASLIPDGATLQTGIGGIPDAVLHKLRHHRDLGVHSEMCADGIIPLVEAGVINGARKTLHPGKLVMGFVLATRRMFDFLHENPAVEMHRTAYVNDPFVIAQNQHMVAINSAIQVDLTGQVCADSIGTRPYSGVGGQADFVRGAARSKGGKPIIALPSTAKHGTISRIAPVLDSGAGVVTSRADVHYVVTEYGIAYLHGKTLRERAEALIEIAHPAFRDSLQDFAERAYYVQRRAVTA